MELVPPWYGPTLEDIFNLRLNDEISVNLNTRFHRADKFSQMKILGPNGPLSLSIPVKKHISQSPISEIKIDYIQKWQNQHWRSIQSGYGRSPFFEYYVESLEQLYAIEHLYLNDFLLATQHWTKTQLKAKWLIETVNEHPSIHTETKWVDPMKPNNFETATNQFQYQQVFDSTTVFIPNTCVIDALFAIGGKQVLSMIS
jgi:hypothetical protein